MGGKGSKPEPIVIYNEPDVPIQVTGSYPNKLRACLSDIRISQFTPNLLRALDGTAPPVRSRMSDPHHIESSYKSSSQPPTFASPFSPPASNTPANSNIDDVVKQRVQREVELHQQKRLVHEQRSADQVRREVEDLLRRQKMWVDLPHSCMRLEVYDADGWWQIDPRNKKQFRNMWKSRMRSLHAISEYHGCGSSFRCEISMLTRYSVISQDEHWTVGGRWKNSRRWLRRHKGYVVYHMLISVWALTFYLRSLLRHIKSPYGENIINEHCIELYTVDILLIMNSKGNARGNLDMDDELDIEGDTWIVVPTAHPFCSVAPI